MPSKETELNNAAFRRLEENIKATYPHGQYVAFVGLIILLFAGGVEVYATKTGKPFGYAIYSEELGPKITERLPWAVPFVWVAFVLGSRGLARLILRPWRANPEYGWWVIGLTALLATALDETSSQPSAPAAFSFF